MIISIDGSEGEGGGQVIRTSLALSMITGKPFEVRNVRARRKNPGLARQHLTCVLAAQKICNAEVLGAQLKSSHLKFSPGEILPGDYEFPIGTAGSTSLVAQTVLPALLTCADPSHVRVDGGTHNRMAPPFEFLKEAFIGTLNRMGPRVEVNMDSYGFYPVGGGSIRLSINPPDTWRGLELLERGQVNTCVRAIVSNLPESIAERECKTIGELANWPISQSEVVVVDQSHGKGNAVLIQLDSELLTEVFSGVGEIGVRAEQVAKRVCRAANEYFESDVPVGPHLADQLMLPSAIAAMHGQSSSYRTMPLTQHSRTHIDIISKFLDIQIRADEVSESCVEIVVTP